MNTTHLTLTPGDTVHGTTPTGHIIRTGTYQAFQNRANTITTNAREYEAIVRWDGDDYDSPVSFDRLTPATEKAPTPLTPQQATRAAALAAHAYQTDPTDDAYTTMTDAIDRATTLGATTDDIITAAFPAR